MRLSVERRNKVTTAIIEKIPVTTYPEIPNLPTNMVGFCPLKRTTPSGWPPGMPKRVQKAIAEAVPTFGMTIRVFYPKPHIASNPIWGRKRDPLVIGEKDDKFYLIAAWE